MIIVVVCLASCKMQPRSTRQNAAGDNKLKLMLHPETGASYKYLLSNESKTDFEANDKEMELLKRYNTEITYNTHPDSAGNYVIGVRYNTIHIYSKTGETESDLDASNATMSADPVEKLLGALQSADSTATVSPTGSLIGVTGYQEIADHILAGIKTDNIAGKTKAREQWKQLVEQNLVKNNIQQLFKIFPDSAVQVGDRWKLESNEHTDFDFHVINFLTVDGIADGQAAITAAAKIWSDSSAMNLMGQVVNADLKGEQQGNYSVSVKSGMLTSGTITAKIAGTIQMLGQTIPVTIKTSVKIEGKEIKE